MTENLTLQPAILKWARERAKLDPANLAASLQVNPAAITNWEQTGSISIHHLNQLAKHTDTPIGYLFLDQPPDESRLTGKLTTDYGNTPMEKLITFAEVVAAEPHEPDCRIRPGRKTCRCLNRIARELLEEISGEEKTQPQ